jgi:hypothetical protein
MFPGQEKRLSAKIGSTLTVLTMLTMKCISILKMMICDLADLTTPGRKCYERI